MRPRAVALLLVALWTSTLWAEDLVGRVVDDRGEAVEFATVVLLDLDLVEVTGADGTFTMGEVAAGEYAFLVIALDDQIYRDVTVCLERVIDLLVDFLLLVLAFLVRLVLFFGVGLFFRPPDVIKDANAELRHE